jgi:hypothetical protein
MTGAKYQKQPRSRSTGSRSGYRTRIPDAQPFTQALKACVEFGQFMSGFAPALLFVSPDDAFWNFVSRRGLPVASVATREALEE